MNFFAENLRALTEKALGPQQQEAADEAFEILKARAFRAAKCGDYKVGLTKVEAAKLKGPGLDILRQRVEGAGLVWKCDRPPGRPASVMISWG